MKELKFKTFTKKEVVIEAKSLEQFTSSFEAVKFMNEHKIMKEDILTINDLDGKTIVYYYE